MTQSINPSLSSGLTANLAKLEAIHNFSSQDVLCEGSLLLPVHTTHPTPVVVMGHGYGSERHFGNQGFIQAFLARGLAVFTFDYRGFGGSEGEPRQIVDPSMQLDDWSAALDYVKTLEQVDGNKLGIWGSSFGGGHVISVSAQRDDISCAVAQVPHCDSSEAFKEVGIKKALTGAAHGLRDLVGSWIGLPPHTIPIVGEVGDGFSVMDHSGWKQHYLAIRTPNTQWQNAIPARSLLKADGYNPIDHAQDITCPVLLTYATQDQGVPAKTVEATSAKIKQCTLRPFDDDHFGCYDGGQYHQEIATEQAEFFAQYLLSEGIN